MIEPKPHRLHGFKDRIVGNLPIIILFFAIAMLLTRAFFVVHTKCEVFTLSEIRSRHEYFNRSLVGADAGTATLCNVTSDRLSIHSIGVPGRERVFTLRIDGTATSTLSIEYLTSCLQPVPESMALQVQSKWSYAQTSTKKVNHYNVTLNKASIPRTQGCPSDSRMFVDGIFEATDSRSTRYLYIVYTTDF